MAELHSSYVKTAFLWFAVTAITVWAGASAKVPGPARSDSEVTRAFREKLAKSKLAADGIQIRVQDGIATLTGKTDIVQHKGTATRMAKSAGAREVRNQIQITQAAKQRMLERLQSGRSRAAATGAPPPARTGSAGTASEPPPASAPAPPPVRRAQIRHAQ